MALHKHGHIALFYWADANRIIVASDCRPESESSNDVRRYSEKITHDLNKKYKIESAYFGIVKYPFGFRVFLYVEPEVYMYSIYPT
jgi:hypothetical protein